MLDHVLEAINAAGVQRTLVVVGYQRERVAEHVGERAAAVTQAEQLGTGHAVQQVEGELRGASEDVLVGAGDIPLITADILRELIDHH
jgi:bifunctional UDP-N-acetylglucosamine pyrophosphorylase/glucosamine-1-phosphate N-acetyltransferase